MLNDFRKFQVTDPFNRQWEVEFRWHQNAITIRHFNGVDVKYYLRCGEETVEQVVGLAHPVLLELATRYSRPLTDSWTVQLASLYLASSLERWQGMEERVLTPSLNDLLPHAEALARRRAEVRAELR